MRTLERSLAYARKQGWLAGPVERWVRNPKHPAGGHRKDLWGFADLIVVDFGTFFFVNAVGSGQVNAHLRKWEKDDVAVEAVQQLSFAGSSAYVEIWMWRKIYRKDSRGARRKMWSVKIHDIIENDGKLEVRDSWEG